MANVCYPMVRGRRLRATRLDGCGNPVLGPDSVVVTKGFISVGLTANIEEGEAINVTNANGEVCVLDQPAPKFNNYSVEISFCDVNPALFALMSGMPTVLNGTDVVGFDVDSEVNADDSGFALELWTGVPTEACEPGAGQSYGYMLLPFVKGGVLGDFTVENAAINFTLTGATTKKGSGWGVGPYDVQNVAGVPGPLSTPVNVGTHLRTFRTTLAPPEADCEPEALGVEATGATAGTPGTTTPANSYPPEDFAALTADPLVADPVTAWTSGQYIVLRDGSFAHWDGAAWDAGIAP
jgi:hypothetical protein